VSERGLKLKMHNRGVSLVEGVLSRGDRRLADVVEEVWRRGARFDGWDERFDLDLWLAVLADGAVDVASYLGTRPVTARLPWDHIDVGLEDGFLLAEYRKALADRLSPPCGKVAGQLVHHTNLRDAEADPRKLVCYDCGVACDLSRMRSDRLAALHALGAEEPVERGDRVMVRRQGAMMASGKSKPKPQVAFAEKPVRRFRLRYGKFGRAAFLGHLDTIRVLGRLLRRAGVEVAYTRGFHPKPAFTFAPALSLGVASLGELLDVSIEEAERIRPHGSAVGLADALLDRLREVSPEGIEFLACWEVDAADRGLAKQLRAYDLAIAPAAPASAAELAAIAERFLATDRIEVARGQRQIDVRALVEEVTVLDGSAAAILAGALGWPDGAALLRARVVVAPDGSAKPIEVAKALGVAGGEQPASPRCQLARLGFVGLEGGASMDVSISMLLRGDRQVSPPLARLPSVAP
jgi:radical SAM-linked protein